ILANRCYLRMPPYVLSGMGLVITPLHTPRRFNPLAQPLEASQKLGGRELVWRFDGGDITSDGGALVLKKLEERTRIVRRFATCFTDYRNPKLIEHPLLDLIAQRVFGFRNCLTGTSRWKWSASTVFISMATSASWQQDRGCRCSCASNWGCQYHLR